MTINSFLSVFSNPFFGITLPILFGYLLHILKKHQEQKQEKREIISLFKTDFSKNWTDFDKLKNIPTKEYFSRMVYNFKGIERVHISGIPEYGYSIFSLKLFETEGIKLSKLLGKKKRILFWELYNSLHDLENTRIILNNIETNNRNYHCFQDLFVKLSDKCYNLYFEFVDEL
jgi:hypothetical protein